MNLSFCSGPLTNAPLWAQPHLFQMAFFPISPEPDRNQIFARADGSAEAASSPARLRAPSRIVQSRRKQSGSRLARTGSFPRTARRGRLCNIATQTKQLRPARSAGLRNARYLAPLRFRLWRALQQAQQIRGQCRKWRAGHRTLRMYDHVPSCGYLQAVAAYDFPDSPPNPVARHRAAKLFLDAESKAAQRLFAGAEENSEVRAGAALSRAVDSIKVSAPHQPRLARKRIPRRPRAIRG